MTGNLFEAIESEGGTRGEEKERDGKEFTHPPALPPFRAIQGAVSKMEAGRSRVYRTGIDLTFGQLSDNSEYVT